MVGTYLHRTHRTLVSDLIPWKNNLRRPLSSAPHGLWTTATAIAAHGEEEGKRGGGAKQNIQESKLRNEPDILSPSLFFLICSSSLEPPPEVCHTLPAFFEHL